MYKRQIPNDALPTVFYVYVCLSFGMHVIFPLLVRFPAALHFYECKSVDEVSLSLAAVEATSLADFRGPRFFFIGSVAVYCLIGHALLCNPLVRTVASYRYETCLLYTSRCV